MSLGISGSHRTGKSTLARAYAQYEGIPYVRTTASEVFKRKGLSPSVTLPFGKRLDVQRAILDEFESLYVNAGDTTFIADRTPIDLIAYTMVELGQKPLSTKHETSLYDYFDDCVTVLNRHFSTVIVVSPALPLIAEEGKASLSRPFIDHLAVVIDGVCLLPAIGPRVFRIPRYEIDLAERVDSICRIVEKRMGDYAKQLEMTEEFTGSPVIYH